MLYSTELQRYGPFCTWAINSQVKRREFNQNPLVRVVGFEPTIHEGRKGLSLVCMPIPTHSHVCAVFPLCRGCTRRFSAQVPSEGFEPSIRYGHRVLSTACIPIPTRRHDLGRNYWQILSVAEMHFITSPTL